MHAPFTTSIRRLRDLASGAGRFEILLLVGWVYLMAAAATRLCLWLTLPASEGVGFPALPGIFSIGLIYDIDFLLLASLPCALALWLVPEKLWAGAASGWVIRVLIFCCVYVLGFVTVAEFLFWDEFGTRFNFISVDYLVYRQEVTDNIWESYPMVRLLSGILGVSLLICWVLRKRLNVALQSKQPFRGRTRIFAPFVLLAAGVVVFIDQTPREWFSNAYSRELASSGPYQFFAAFRNNELDYTTFYLTADNQTVADELHEVLASPGTTFFDPDPMGLYRQIDNPGTEARLNVMLIMVESLSASYLSRFGEEADITPNLDALTDESLFFSNLYATGTRTTRGLEAVTLSIPPTPGHSIVKRLGRETGYWSLGNVLREKAYDTRFIYGGRGYFDNMSAFFAGNGYQVMDQSSVADAAIEFSNAWGMADEDLYDVALSAADDAEQAGKPFFFHVMTTSNHRPYTYPEGRIAIPSGTGRQGAVMYTDYAIGRLLAEARTHSWFDQTLFVIVADHCAGSAGKESLPVERYHIPMWVYGPGLVEPGEVQALASQIDIAPTLLGLLNMDYASSAFGGDLLHGHPTGRALIGNYQYLGLLNDGRLTVLEPQQKLEQFSYAPDEPASIVATANSPDLLRAQSYYQEAAWVYGHRLNDWSRHRPMADVRGG